MNTHSINKQTALTESSVGGDYVIMLIKQNLRTGGGCCKKLATRTKYRKSGLIKVRYCAVV